MKKILLSLIILVPTFSIGSHRDDYTNNNIPTSDLTLSYMKSNFQESNAEMTPFSDPTDHDLVEEEREGIGWRFVSSNAGKHKNIIFYNHGTGGRKKEYYRFANDHPWKVEKPGRNLHTMSEWFDKYNISFYAPLRKETDVYSNYGLSIEPVEVFYHLTNLVGNDVNICYVGHSEGGASVLFTSMYLNGKHVSISPGYGHSPFHLTGNRYEETPVFYNKSKNLTILIGGYETDNNLSGFYKGTRNLPSNIKVKVIGNLTHQEIASDQFIEEWGVEVVKGCGFN
jgi:hypothetical protein